MSKDFSIAVIGLGLIGGSILKALKPKNFHLTGVSGREETIAKAKELDLADEYSTDIESVKDAKIIFICTPIHKIIPFAEKVSRIVSPDCIITDVGSIKGSIIDHIDNSEFPINFIGGHPMAGTEHKGIDNAADNLFEGAKWVLTPSRWSESQDIEELKELISSLGAKVIIANPFEHDRAVALISHLPLLLSQALFGMVDKYPDESIRDLALTLAASGFRDTTRLAATNPELAKDMLLLNKINIREAVKNLEDYLSKMDKNLDLDEEKFMELAEELASNRKNLYSPEGKNIYKENF
ncbi:MAG: prephenate dehydrogenase/arogenate dehydrogenase family protein [Candidatus Gastranaerophilales bacterium]|nr:prephenate dehydrogenase/arogenate dehydrogenase family protein [Candidatus Gastranaerophilales bacterium]